MKEKIMKDTHTQYNLQTYNIFKVEGLTEFT